LLTPTDHTLIMIDFQSQMAFATKSIDPVALCNNAALVANTAKIFNVSTILTTVAEKSFSGPMFDEIKAAFPGKAMLDRTSMNTWEDKTVIDEVNRIGKGRVVLAGLWTSVCIVGPALSALEQGFEVYVITDACGDVSDEAHERAVERMVQLGARPMTSLQYLLELQRDWGQEQNLRSHDRSRQDIRRRVWSRDHLCEGHVRRSGRRSLTDRSASEGLHVDGSQP
jgi:nicotinamidase-related amidase